MHEQSQLAIAQFVDRVDRSAKALTEAADRVVQSVQSMRAAVADMKAAGPTTAAEEAVEAMKDASARTAREALARALDMLSDRTLDIRPDRRRSRAAQHEAEFAEAAKKAAKTYADVTRALQLKWLRLDAAAISPDEIELTWDLADPNSVEDFTISRCEGEGCTAFADLAKELAPGTKGFVDNSVTRGRTYRYRLSAATSDGGELISITQVNTDL